MKKILLIFAFVITCSFSFAEDDDTLFKSINDLEFGMSKSFVIEKMSQLKWTIVRDNGNLTEIQKQNEYFEGMRISSIAMIFSHDELISFSIFIKPDDMEKLRYIDHFAFVTNWAAASDFYIDKSNNTTNYEYSDGEMYILFTLPRDTYNPFWIVSFGEESITQPI